MAILLLKHSGAVLFHSQKRLGGLFPCARRKELTPLFLWFLFNFLRNFLLRYPMLRRGFRNHVSGALKALPCVGV